MIINIIIFGTVGVEAGGNTAPEDPQQG